MMLDKVRTEYSFGQAYGQMDKVIAACTGTHVLIADTNTWGHLEFYSACKAAGKVPILGVTIGIVDDVFMNKNRVPDMWAILAAVNDEGLKELYGLVHMSHTFSYYQPRIGIEDLLSISPNIRVILQNSAMLSRVKGHAGVWVGVSPSDYRWSAPAAAKLGLPTIAVSDNYYPRPEHRQAYEILCRTPENKTSAMHILNWDELGDALQRAKAGGTSALAFEAAWTKFTEGVDIHLPKAETIHIAAKKTLRQLGIEGAKRKGINLKDKVYKARFERELELIAEKKFEDYFHLVADLCMEAKKVMLVGPARGSSAGSLVCYLLDITEIDPIPHKLLFERFIDITRADLPDIDIDFPDTEWVFKYLQNKYGVDKVAHLGTVLTYMPKSAIGDVAKALGIPEWEVKPVKDAVIERSQGDARSKFCLKDTFESLDVGKALLVKYPAIAIAADLEEHSKSSGTHAAGIVVCNEPVFNYCGVTAENIACVNKKDAEKINLLKIDALGLRTLIILQDVLQQIGKGNEFLYSLPLEDEGAFKVLTDGKYAGIFQFEGYALKSLTAQMGVRSFEDIVSIVSLARPGPLHSGAATEYIQRRIGNEEVSYMHPMLEETTKDTLGIIIYQETVMSICREIGKFSWEDTSLIRKAMSKSLGDEFFGKYKEQFVKGAATNKIKKEDAEYIFKNIMTFGCLSGNTILRLPCGNQYTPRQITLRELYENKGVGIVAASNKNWWSQRNRGGAKLYAMGPDAIRPEQLIKVVYSGEKETWLLELEDGKNIRATKDHKFMAAKGWVKLGNLKIGQSIAVMGEDKKPKGYKGTGSGAHNKRHGQDKLFLERQQYLRDNVKICQRCEAAPNEHTHHKDGNRMNNEWDNLLPVCVKCHRILHREMGEKPPYPHRRGKEVEWVTIISISNPLLEDTYDICMPEPNNNFIANDIVVHNSMAFNRSHGVAYGVVSYWCAWCKAHYPLEFAAATLRNLKDSDQAIKMLRELVKEGYEYIPFDPKLSQLNWSVQKGKLIGGWLGVKGVGEKKAAILMNKIANDLPMTHAERLFVEKPDVPWTDLFPAERLFGHMYKDYDAEGLSMPVSYINDINTDGEYIIIGQIMEKNLRDANEYQSVVKRGGKIIKHNSIWLNMFIADDTGSIIVSIPRATYEELGKPIVEHAAIGDWYMFRGKLSGGWRKLTVEKVRRLSK